MRVLRALALIPIGALVLAAGASGSRVAVKGLYAVMFYGEPIKTPIVVQPDTATAALFAALARDTLRGARDSAGSVAVAVFLRRPQPWWAVRVADTLPTFALHPNAAEVHGRLYPPVGTKPALLLFDTPVSPFPGRGWTVTPAAARMLSSRGVPRSLLTR